MGIIHLNTNEQIHMASDPQSALTGAFHLLKTTDTTQAI